MKSFLKLFAKALPLGLGIVMALLSFAFTVNVTHSDSDQPIDVIAAIFFGIIGYPLLIAGALSLIRDKKDI
jgi:hypothetical protein